MYDEMSKPKNRILFLSANPPTTSRIMVDEEARVIFERLQEGPYRDRFKFYNHPAAQPEDLQRLLLTHQPHIVHFSGHGTRSSEIVLHGKLGEEKTVNRQGLANLFALYNHHVRLVVLNACCTRAQARAISSVVDYAIGTSKEIGDTAAVTFAGVFYRVLGFGKSVKVAFESAKGELGLTRTTHAPGINLFMRDGVNAEDTFPQV
jgi:CHAT domain-containing protein